MFIVDEPAARDAVVGFRIRTLCRRRQIWRRARRCFITPRHCSPSTHLLRRERNGCHACLFSKCLRHIYAVAHYRWQEPVHAYSYVAAVARHETATLRHAAFTAITFVYVHKIRLSAALLPPVARHASPARLRHAGQQNRVDVTFAYARGAYLQRYAPNAARVAALRRRVHVCHASVRPR